MSPRTALAALISLAACGGNGSVGIDAAASRDGSSSAVRAVTCPPGDMPTITTSEVAYVPPSLGISVGGIVKFVMSPAHNTTPDPSGSSDPALLVDFGATACFEFDKAGTYGFLCSVHRFSGQILVR